jgi:hypothetical protein
MTHFNIIELDELIKEVVFDYLRISSKNNNLKIDEIINTINESISEKHGKLHISKPLNVVDLIEQKEERLAYFNYYLKKCEYTESQKEMKVLLLESVDYCCRYFTGDPPFKDSFSEFLNINFFSIFMCAARFHLYMLEKNTIRQ